MKIKCKVCGKRYMPCKETTYQVKEELSGLAALSEKYTIYDATDCPRCGTQCLLGIRVPIYKENEDECEHESESRI